MPRPGITSEAEFARLLEGRRLIMASHRGPVEFKTDDEGKLQPHRGSGGVVTALSGLCRYLDLDWVASAMKEGDRRMARQEDGAFRVSLTDADLSLKLVVNPRAVYHKHYSVFCNPLLWFIQHYMWNWSRTPNIDASVYDAWENGYKKVNRSFADAVLEQASTDSNRAAVIIHDYHLYLVPSLIKESMPNLPIQHFTHIPWPSPRYWQLLPRHMREAIISSLCCSDIVGLQTRRDVDNFLLCCHYFFPDAEVDYEKATIKRDNHLTRVRAYPISVDVQGLNETAASAAVSEYQTKIEAACGIKTIIRVDRAEPSKNIIRGFRAYEQLLTKYPQFRGQVKFLAFMVPSRSHLKPYQRYVEDVFSLIDSINTAYGTEDWQPIECFYENNYHQALAAMKRYDVLMVNAVIDGMNLVAKEGVTVNRRDGILLLSETVGAWEQLGEYALSTAAADIEGTCNALYHALTMTDEERKLRATALRESVAAEDLAGWIRSLVGDIASI